MESREVEVIDREVAYGGYFRIDRYRLRHSLHEGGSSDVLSREVLERGQVSAVLPVDVDRGTVVLIEQFRIGAYAAGWDPWLLEAVAGVLEPGEDHEALALREAREEAGCEITELRPIARYLSSPGACSETVALYCGRVDSRGLGGIHGLAHEGEDIRVLVMPVAAALALLEEGRIVNSKTLIALQWLALNYDALAAEWRSG